MKKNKFIILLVLPVFLCGCSLYNNTSINNSKSEDSLDLNLEKVSVKKTVEEKLYSFSTEILDKDPGRQNNIKLTCSTLNGTIVNSGATFSFCDTVGKATPDKGYQKAKIFDADGNVTQGYGGGNCQVSSTLYNAILQDANFEVVERHPHAQTVDYVEERKRCFCCMWKCRF